MVPPHRLRFQRAPDYCYPNPQWQCRPDLHGNLKASKACVILLHNNTARKWLPGMTRTCTSAVNSRARYFDATEQ